MIVLIVVIILLTGMANAISESKSVFGFAKNVSEKSWKN